MKTRDIVTITGTAIFTAAVALTILWPAFVDAGSDGLNPKIESPRLTENGVDLTLIAARPYLQGEQPEFELTGNNTTAESVTITVESSMKAFAGPVLTMPDGSLRSVSRIPSRPQELFRQKHTLTFGPHETRRWTISTKTVLPGNSMVDVFLQTADDGNTSKAAVQVLSFATGKAAFAGPRATASSN